MRSDAAWMRATCRQFVRSCAKRRLATTGSRRSCSASCTARRSRCASPSRLIRSVHLEVDARLEVLMYISKMSLDRRTFLRGVGAAVALPLLDAMVPALTPLAKAAAAPKTRFGAIYIPNGAIVDEFFPKASGTNWEFTPILKPLEPFKDQLVVVKNLTRSHPGSQVGDHAVSVGGYLTGVWPKRTEAEDVYANTTIDQVI